MLPHDEVVGLFFQGEEIGVVLLELEREQGAKLRAGVGDGFAGHRAGAGGEILAVLREFGDLRLQFGVAGFELQVESREFVGRRRAFDDRAGLFRPARTLLTRPGLRGGEFAAQRLHVLLDLAQCGGEVETSAAAAAAASASAVARFVNWTLPRRVAPRLRFRARLLRARHIDGALFLRCTWFVGVAGFAMLALVVVVVVTPLGFFGSADRLILHSVLGVLLPAFGLRAHRFQDRRDFLRQLRHLLAQRRLPAAAPADHGLLHCFQRLGMELSEQSVFLRPFQNAELRDRRMRQRENGEHRAMHQRIGLGGLQLRECELRHPRLRAPDEDIGKNLRVLRRERARILVAHFFGHGHGDLQRHRSVHFKKRPRHTQPHPACGIGFVLAQSREELRAKTRAQLRPHLLDRPHAHDPRHLRQRVHGPGHAGAAAEERVLEQLRHALLLRGSQPRALRSLGELRQFIGWRGGGRLVLRRRFGRVGVAGQSVC